MQVAFADSTRRLLDFQFAGLPPTPSTVASILAVNFRLLIGAIAASVIVQAASTKQGAIGTVVVAALDTIILLEFVLNVVVIGSSLGAYGGRMATAMLPHGPFELVAFAAVIALYLRARRRAVPARQLVAVSLGACGLLLVAAVLETFVAL